MNQLLVCLIVQTDWVRTSGRSYDTPLLIDGLEELTNDQRNRLNPLDFLLCSDQFMAQIVGFISDIFLPVSL